MCVTLEDLPDRRHLTSNGESVGVIKIGWDEGGGTEGLMEVLENRAIRNRKEAVTEWTALANSL